MQRLTRISLLVSVVAALPTVAHAQSDELLIRPSIPAEYDRDRNVSVKERTHPDYDPVGIRAGAFIISPSLQLGSGFTNNVYLTSANKTSDGYAAIDPYVQIGSDWSRHQFSLQSAADIRRFFRESPRNQNAWYVNGLGRIDVNYDLNITFEGQVGRAYESPYSGANSAQNLVLSTYLRSMQAARAEYKAGRTRFVLAYDHTAFVFSNLRYADGSIRSQQDRNREINRVVGLAEYALSPSISAYTELSYDKTDYSHRLLTGQPNRDSNGYRAIAGFNFDLAGMMRGQIGLGYAYRDYTVRTYHDAQGFSAQAKVEFFPTELYTVTIEAQRLIEDSSLGNGGAYFDNRVSGRIDHEVLQNLILTAGAEFAKQDYLQSPAYNNVFRVSGGATYQATREVGFATELAYGKTDPHGPGLGNRFDELRGQLSIKIRR